MFEGMQSPSPPRRRGKSPTIIFNKGDRGEHPEYEEVFGGPRRKQDPRPGTSTGSRPSGRLFRDFRGPRTASDDEEEEETREGSESVSGRGPPEIGGWERAQEGEREKGKGGSKRKVVRREDAEDVEVVKKVNVEEEREEEREEEGEEEQLKEFGAELFEHSEKFEGEESLRSGTMDQIRDQLSGTGLGPYDEMSSTVYFRD